jgi:competence protein ComEC
LKFDIDCFRTKPFLLLTPLAILGILGGAWLIQWPWSVIMTTCFLGSLLLPIDARWKNMLILLSFFSAFIVRYHLADTFIAKNHYLNVEWNRIVSYRGIIKDAVYRTSRTNRYLLQLKTVQDIGGTQTTTGKIMVYSERHFSYGDILELSKQWQQPTGQRNPGQFNYRDYLNRNDIYAIVYLTEYDSVSVVMQGHGNWFFHCCIEPVRSYLQRMVHQCNTSTVSSLLKALLLGERQDLDPAVVQQFTLSGVVHVLAISGLHVGYIILFITILLQLLRFPYRSQFIILLVVLTVYVLLVRFKPSVLRASLMAALYIYGKIREKKIDNKNILLGTAFLLLLFDPRDLFNPGFQFSFLAVLGILILFPRLKKRIIFGNSSVSKILLQYIWYGLIISFSATLFTLPLTIYYYGVWPIYAVPVNLIIIPLVGIMLFLGFMQILLALISIHLALGIGQLIELVYQLMTAIIHATMSLPLAFLDLPKPSWVLIVLSYMGIVFLLALNKHNRIKGLFALLSILLCYIVIGKWGGRRPGLIVTMLDVGHGDAAVIHFPNGNTILIDGGDCTANFDHGLQTVLPYLKQKGVLHLTYAVISHGHRDHAGGVINLMDRVRIDTVVISDDIGTSPLITQIIEKCERHHYPLRKVIKGDCLYPDPACRLYVLHPAYYDSTSATSSSSCNNQSMVVKLQYGASGILFTGDIEAKGIEDVLCFDDFLESELIKLPHHGSMVSTTPDLLSRVNPVIAIASASAYRRFNLPSRKLIQFFNTRRIPFLQTGREGAIMFELTPTSIRRIHWR